MEEILHVIMHTGLDALKLLPFLFITYLIMEYVEHKMSDKSRKSIKKAGKFGPLVGSIVGAFPQCGFSVSATNLYAGRIITLGTLIAVYLSTSDEMLPILISEAVGLEVILKLIGLKILIGMVIGFLIDLVIRKKEETKITEVCEHDHCNCQDNGIVKSAIKHTLNIFIFILIISIVLHIGIEIIGEEILAGFILNKPILGPIIAGLIGLIPNCAASIVLTQLYLERMLTAGSMIAGLLVGAGMGLAILFKVNKNLKQNLKILGILYIIGVTSGIVLNLIQFRV